MTLVRTQNEFMPELIGTRGFGSGTGISKIGAISQGSKLGYRLARYAYKRYFRYATRTKSRAAGTATGAGLGIGGGLVNFAPVQRQRRNALPYQLAQKRLRYQQRNRRKHQRCCC